MGQRMKMPSCIEVYLVKCGLSAESVVAFACADLTEKGLFGETYVILMADRVIVLNNCYTEDKIASTVERHEDLCKEFMLEDIEDVCVENLATGGILVAKIGGQNKILCRFTNSRAREFSTVAKCVSRIKEGKELSEEVRNDDEASKYCAKCGLLFPEQNRKICPKCLEKGVLFNRVLSFAPRYKWKIALVLLCMILASLLAIVTPYIGGNIIFDEIISETGHFRGYLLHAVMLMALTRLFSMLISVYQGRVNASVAAEVMYDIKCKIFAAMQRLSLQFYNDKQTGSLMVRVNGDSMQLQYFFHDGLPLFIVNILNITGIGLIMLMLNWVLALLVLLPVPIIVIILMHVHPKLSRLFSRNYRRNSLLSALVNDSLTGARVVKAFGKEKTEVDRFSVANNGLYKANVELGNFTSTVFPLTSYLMGLGAVTIWGYGGFMVASGNMTFGTLITFTGYLGMIYGPLNFMSNMVNWWSSSMNAASRIFEIIDAIPEIADKVNPVRIPNFNGDIELKNVTFGYLPNKPVLHDVSFHVKPNEMIGIIGQSGAGKTTIVNLIARLYDPNEGTILIDGVDAKDIALSDIRSQMAMVLQETFIFTGSILDNITYAKPNASKEDVIEAAIIASAHDFIMKLPDGYETIVGVRGFNLSGGEKQRIAIARAILIDPRILILDEATSTIDTQTEMQIQKALNYLTRNRTTIAIAHRLSTLRNAEKLVVIENGKVAETGTHDELIKLKGSYFKLYRIQNDALKFRGVEN